MSAATVRRTAELYHPGPGISPGPFIIRHCVGPMPTSALYSTHFFRGDVGIAPYNA